MELKQLAAQHRNAILRREAQTATLIDGQYKVAWSRILARLVWLQTQMQQSKALGRAPDIAWLYEAQRLQIVLASIQSDMHTFSQAAQVSIRAQLTEAQQAGHQDAQRILLAANIAAASAPPQSSAQLALPLHTGPAAHRFAAIPGDAAHRANGVILAGFAAGWTLGRIVATVQQQVSIMLRDALRWSRTLAMESYRDATLDTYRANPNEVVGWRWIAAEGACPICSDLNGSRHSLDEDQEAPHNNCRCGQEPILASDNEDEIRSDWGYAA